MSHYIVCPKKRSNPRIDVRICQIKCQMKGDCKEYSNYNKGIIQNNNIQLLPHSSPSVVGTA